MPGRLSKAKSRRIFWLAAIVVLGAAVAHFDGGNIASGAGGRARVGRPAPDFTLKLFSGPA
jgi:hypothetical protein